MTVLDYSIVFVYIVSIVVIGVMLQRRASAGIDSYFLGNRDMPWWALGASGMASNMDVAGTMINTAWIFALGATGMFIEIRGGVTLIMAFLMIFMGKWNRRAKVMTMAEWMKFRFGTDKQGHIARLISAISIIVIITAMITYFAVGAGKFISTFLGIPHLGTVKSTLQVEDIQNVDVLIQQIDAETAQLSNVLQNDAIHTVQLKPVSNAWRELKESWDNVNKNPNSISRLTTFESESRNYQVVVKSFHRWMSSTSTPLAEDVGGETNAGIERILGDMASIHTIYDQAVDYKIYLKDQTIAALIMIVLAMIYTVASGLYGVVWTDVFQGILIFGTIAYICILVLIKFDIPELFSISIPMRDGTFQAIETTRQQWTSIIPRWQLNFPAESTYSIYNLFGVAILFYLMKVTIEGCGGTSGYMIQRYYAAKSDRDAGLLSLFWTFLLSFRWPFISAIAIMGVVFGATQGVISDPEKVLPIVVMELVPTGIKGMIVAGLIAAAMSTFDSTVNAGAAYWVKDIYQAYINPKASEKKLMLHSRWASVAIVFVALLFSMAVRNINEIWGWITMSIGAGMFIPTLVRWYWWRMNGWGFAIGTAVGMIVAVLQRLLIPDVPEYVSFIIASSTSFVGMLLGTLLTKPTDQKVLIQFYKTTRPFGFWKPVRKAIGEENLKGVDEENRRDKISIFFAVPWQLALFLMWITVMMRRWDSFSVLLVIIAVLSSGLYYFWYRHLSKEVTVN